MTVRPPLVKILFIAIRTHWKLNWIITASKLIIFYCLTTFHNITLLKYFFFLGLFWSFFKFFYLKRIILFVNEAKCSLLYLNIWVPRKLDWCIIFRGVYTEEYSWRVVRLIHICYASIIVYTEREFSKTSSLDLPFLFIQLSSWINLNKFELIHLLKSMKSTLILSINVGLKVTRVFYI